MQRVIIIGGGAAGMMAAIFSAGVGADTLLLEKMPNLGSKLKITGKGRGNITNIADHADFIKNIPGNGKFLHSALNFFSNQDVMEFFETMDVILKIERGGRVFPASDHAQDFIDALEKYMSNRHVKIRRDTRVKKILTEQKKIAGVELTTGEKIPADRIVLATGGRSYPGTGSTGDGYNLAKNLGHTIETILPSLVPLETVETFPQDLQGLSLKNVRAKFFLDGKKKAEQFGEMLFTHFGISGPIILTLSREVSIALNSDKNSEAKIFVDLKPALSFEKLQDRILRDFSKFRRKSIKNAMVDLLPKKLIPVVLNLSEIDPELQVDQLSQNSRKNLVDTIKNLPMTIKATRPIDEAIVTIGGVSTKEINPKTMESKIVSGLFFAGEIIDVDGYTGGFNLQAAFSTGAVAGNFAAST